MNAVLRIACGTALGLLVTTAPRAEPVVLPAPGTGAWRPLDLPKVDEKTVYTPIEDGGRRAVHAESQCAASALVIPTPELDLDATPMLRWSWRVDRALTIENERAKPGDDFAARVYVLFAFEPKRASFFARARHRLGKALYGDLVPGSAVNYSWTSREPRGEAWDNPFSDTSKMVSLGPGEVETWRSERVDVRADFTRLFGHAPPQALALALMTDSDNSCQAAEARFADFRFEAR